MDARIPIPASPLPCLAWPLVGRGAGLLTLFLTPQLSRSHCRSPIPLHGLGFGLPFLTLSLKLFILGLLERCQSALTVGWEWGRVTSQDLCIRLVMEHGAPSS